MTEQQTRSKFRQRPGRIRLGARRPSALLPVSIVTGFLGSGKTTLLNHIVRAELGIRFGVLVNDFGSVNIDTKLIEHVEDNTISLSNGCICCSIREDFLRALVELFKRPEPPEFVIVETSGVSDPTGVVATLTNSVLRDVFRIDTILTVVDASEFLNLGRHRWELAEAQVSLADMVVINKADLVMPDTIDAVRAAVNCISPKARLIAVSHARVPLELIVPNAAQLHPFPRRGSSRALPQLTSGARARRQEFYGNSPCPQTHQDGKEHSCSCHGSSDVTGRLSAAFESWSYETDQLLSLVELRRLLRDLPREIYRLKGIFYVDEDRSNALVLQVVGNRINEAVLEPWGDKPKRTTVVAIGDAGCIDGAALTQRFDSCVTSPSEPTQQSIVQRAVSYLRDKGIIGDA